MTIKVERPVQLHPLIRRITANNPGIFTGPGTNTYVLGKQALTIIDPGPNLGEHQEAILAIPGEIEQIIVTHTHPDHSPGAASLKKKLKVPVYGILPANPHDQDLSFEPSATLTNQQIINGDGFDLRVICTPGHASNHVCLLMTPGGVLFSGDHIMNGSTVVIRPPDGDMRDYINSLVQLDKYGIETIAPGHGTTLDDPKEAINWIIQHRLNRERKVLKILREAGCGTAKSLVSKVYDDVNLSLHSIAVWSLEAHLIKLTNDGVIAHNNGIYSI
ncbi:MAG: MBL fold metallo-hydrolase [Acidiferrobacteraceae bacterium]|nr:MBL fold metallo-hydrolase [Acidiferrobacteraceae bacterium]|tara:strand:+ start:397 stop:1218 length:822 start_codon:yes stop_codon:yes gene_type:complete